MITPSPARRPFVAGHAAAACLLVAAFFGFRALAPGEDAQRPAIAVAAAPHPTRMIEDIRPGMKVAARNPDVGSGARAEDTAVDPPTWRLVRLRYTDRWPDGTLDEFRIETLMPAADVQKLQAARGVWLPVPLDLTEMGLPEGTRAEVVSIEPCPAIAPGPGRVVLTTISHLHPNVWELEVRSAAGQVEAIRPTATHKMHSVRRGWQNAADLHPGEALTSHAGALTLLSARRLPGVHRVYNLTVETEHVYFVSTLGALAHNMGCSRPGQRPSNAPSGTLTINKHPDTSNIVHKIKPKLLEDGVGPASYVGISPEGNVIVTNLDGTAELQRIWAIGVNTNN